MSYGGGPGGCLTSARFSMRATILRQDSNYQPVEPDVHGEWVNSQDPLTKEIVRTWKPFIKTPDDLTTPAFDPQFQEISCLARGIVDGGIRVAGTTERFGDTYENIDFVKMWVPGNVVVTKRDRMTNIKDRSGSVIWRDEEFEVRNPDAPVSWDNVQPSSIRATIFNVNGVTPLFNAYNQVVEQFVLLEKVEVNGAY